MIVASKRQESKLILKTTNSPAVTLSSYSIFYSKLSNQRIILMTLDKTLAITTVKVTQLTPLIHFKRFNLVTAVNQVITATSLEKSPIHMTQFTEVKPTITPTNQVRRSIRI